MSVFALLLQTSGDLGNLETAQEVEGITEMTKEIVSMKDRVITSQDQEIENLKKELLRRDDSMKKLKQSVEDMEMLTQTLVKK